MPDLKTNNAGRPRPEAAFRYGVALFLTFGALGFSLALRPKIKLDTFNLFQGSVFLSALYGGLGPGIAASFLSIALINYFFIPPFHTFSIAWFDDGVNMAVFGALTLLTSSLSANLRRAKADLQRAHDGLEVRVQQRTDELSQAVVQLHAEVADRLEAERAILDISSREQRRMGQDLHDGLSQTLAGLRLLADVLREKLTARALPEVAMVDKMESRLSDAMAQADDISRGLYPVELETHGLMAALHEMARTMSNVYSVECRFVSRRTALIKDSAVATHLFRITQEAVMNAIKGGKAKAITVRFFQWNARSILAVADTGVGFDPAARHQGMGMNIMNYRARFIGAALAFRSRRGGGTLVGCAFPAQLLEKESGHGL